MEPFINRKTLRVLGILMLTSCSRATVNDTIMAGGPSHVICEQDHYTEVEGNKKYTKFEIKKYNSVTWQVRLGRERRTRLLPTTPEETYLHQMIRIKTLDGVKVLDSAVCSTWSVEQGDYESVIIAFTGVPENDMENVYHDWKDLSNVYRQLYSNGKIKFSDI